MTKMTSPIIPVILSGGSGTRLWPLSRALYPKQFLPLTGDNSLFQNTMERVRGIDKVTQGIVVCNEEHRFMAAEQLRQIELGDTQIILEPVGRNTAPAIAIAALQAMQHDQDAVLLVLPADHIVHDVSAFHATAKTGYAVALEGHLVTFGIVPDRPETGFGYIRQGSQLAGLGNGCKVDAFIEKPDHETAESYLSAGNYLWNSGMFMFNATRYLDELKAHAPDIHDVCVQAFESSASDLDFIRVDREKFEQCPSNSIDYAVMEETSDAAVVPLAAGWSDVGSWQALWEAEAHCESENFVAGDVINEDCRGCYINATHRLVGAVGLEDMIVVETADAILVAPKARSQDVRLVVDRLKSSRRNEAVLHRKVYRPWGAYEGIDAEDRFQVKRITVNSGQTLSLQMHHHRAEHWIVVKGTARVTCGDKEFMLSENESTYIPIGSKHRLENPGKIPLELIEVQSGSYLGEDDIVRYEDKYGR